MAGDSHSENVLSALRQHCARIRRPRGSVLFRRGEKASGMFVLFSGRVSLDFGVDSVLDCSCGPGALVGLFSAISRHTYSLTATVTDDAELGFVNSQGLDSLLHQCPHLCEELLMILREKKANDHPLASAWQLH